MSVMFSDEDASFNATESVFHIIPVSNSSINQITFQNPPNLMSTHQIQIFEQTVLNKLLFNSDLKKHQILHQISVYDQLFKFLIKSTNNIEHTNYSFTILVTSQLYALTVNGIMTKQSWLPRTEAHLNNIFIVGKHEISHKMPKVKIFFSNKSRTTSKTVSEENSEEYTYEDTFRIFDDTHEFFNRELNNTPLKLNTIMFKTTNEEYIDIVQMTIQHSQ
ncbi:Hypothetical_protein [Hexamita inflata]|uniref:Hypothetical_protein n=1 Tax=Hexamita inflata TaxID=28002 RepID=A0AA86RMH2_9EUKA|nr:Hypothetical protein HINF_LOCUS62379 [Hexamita inflata]